MPIKRVLITHTSRKSFLGKGLEHYLRNRLRSVSLAVPKIDHGKISSHIISQNIVDCEVPKFCEIFCEILISQNIICFRKILWKDFSKIFSKIVFLISKSFFILLENTYCKRILSRIFEEFYTAASRIIRMFENFILSWTLAVYKLFSLRFYFLKIQSLLFLFKKVLHGFKPCSIRKKKARDFIYSNRVQLGKGMFS